MTKKILYEGKFLRLIRDKHWEYVERTNGIDVVYIIPLKYDGHEKIAVLTKEYRIPVGNYVIGFPAGLVGDIDNNEDIITAAHRELFEETGYNAKRMRHVVTGPASSGLSNETIHYYIADGLIKSGDGGGDDTEDIEVIEIPLNDVERQITDKFSSCDIDIKLYSSIYWANKLDIL